jgi:spermidine/putrescine transport system permease protein
LKSRDKGFPVFFLLVIIGVLLFLFFPTVIIILFSFSAEKTFPISAFTMKWYAEIFKSKEFMSAIKNSLQVALISATSSVVLGTVASFTLNKFKFKFKNILNTFYMVPIAVPGLILGISILIFFSFLNAKLSLVTVTLSHIVFCIPFVLLIMNSRLEKLDFTIEEAAVDLGANPYQVFTKVTFPMIRSSLFGAFLIAFAVSFDEFVVTFFTAGSKKTIPLLVYGMMRRGMNPAINAISSIVVITSLILIVVSFRVLKVNIRL